MKQITKKIILFSLGIAIVVLMGATECMCSLDFNNYTANVVNIQPSDTTDDLRLDGATISLYAYDYYTDTYANLYDTVELYSESFSFMGIEPGRYMISGSKTGWTFVPLFIEVDNTGVTSQDMYAYPSTQTAGNIEYDAEYTIITRWEDPTIDVDLVLTYGDDLDDPATFNWAPGDAKVDDDLSADRFRITPFDPTTTGSREGIMHHGDVNENSPSTTPRVETISIFNDAWFSDGDSLRIYIDSPNASSSPLLTGNLFTADGDAAAPSAFVQLDIMRGTSHYGTWYAPYNTFEETLHMVTALYEDGSPAKLWFSSANNVTDMKSINRE